MSVIAVKLDVDAFVARAAESGWSAESFGVRFDEYETRVEAFRPRVETIRLIAKTVYLRVTRLLRKKRSRVLA